MKLFQRLYAVRLHRREAAAEDNSGSIKVMATDQFMTINGLRLHYLDFGNPSKPPLICIHGLSGNAHNFDGLAPHLMNDHHVMSIDVRGRGDSEWGPPGDYTPPVYV